MTVILGSVTSACFFMIGAILKATNISFQKVKHICKESYEATCIHIWTALVTLIIC